MLSYILLKRQTSKKAIALTDLWRIMIDVTALLLYCNKYAPIEWDNQWRIINLVRVVPIFFCTCIRKKHSLFEVFCCCCFLNTPQEPHTWINNYTIFLSCYSRLVTLLNLFFFLTIWSVQQFSTWSLDVHVCFIKLEEGKKNNTSNFKTHFPLRKKQENTFFPGPSVSQMNNSCSRSICWIISPSS